MTERTHGVPGTGEAFSRRRMLALCASAVVLPSALGACTSGTGGGGVSDTDAILALADQARADAGLLSAAVTNDSRLTAAFEPLRAARMEHAAALDAMGRRTTPPPNTPTGDTSTVDGNTVKDAIIASAKATANAVTGATPDQAGVLAGVFACCATYSDPRASLESVQVPNRSSDDSTDSATRVAVDSLQRALAGEHAAIWAYTLALAFVPPDWAARARDDIEAHKELRTTLTEALTAQGEKPVSAQPAYAPPQPVLDAVSAGALLVTAEADTTSALRSMIERASTPKLRVLGLSWMTGSTGRSAFWRGATDRAPAIPAFPGRE